MAGLEAWHWSRRFGFRFVLVMVLLVSFDTIQIGGPVQRWWEALWAPIVPWISAHLLRIGTDFPRFGGAETTWTYIQAGTSVALALAAAVAWSLIDRRHLDHRRLDQWLRVYLRVYLASVLFGYG